MVHVDEIFKMLCDYLSMLPIDSDTEVLFISDGADCLWKRVPLVEKTVRDKGGRFRCLLDYYHMKGYLHDMAGVAKGCTVVSQCFRTVIAVRNFRRNNFVNAWTWPPVKISEARPSPALLARDSQPSRPAHGRVREDF